MAQNPHPLPTVGRGAVFCRRWYRDLILFLLWGEEMSSVEDGTEPSSSSCCGERSCLLQKMAQNPHPLPAVERGAVFCRRWYRDLILFLLWGEEMSSVEDGTEPSSSSCCGERSCLLQKMAQSPHPLPTVGRGAVFCRRWHRILILFLLWGEELSSVEDGTETSSSSCCGERSCLLQKMVQNPHPLPAVERGAVFCRRWYRALILFLLWREELSSVEDGTETSSSSYCGERRCLLQKMVQRPHPLPTVGRGAVFCRRWHRTLILFLLWREELSSVEDGTEPSSSSYCGERSCLLQKMVQSPHPLPAVERGAVFCRRWYRALILFLLWREELSSVEDGTESSSSSCCGERSCLLQKMAQNPHPLPTVERGAVFCRRWYRDLILFLLWREEMSSVEDGTESSSSSCCGERSCLLQKMVQSPHPLPTVERGAVFCRRWYRDLILFLLQRERSCLVLTLHFFLVFVLDKPKFEGGEL